MRRICQVLLIAFAYAFVLSFTETRAQAQTKRVALVIGISTYDHTRALPNAATDAKAIKSALESIGFAVTLVQDANYDDLRRSIRTFGTTAAESEMALVYFAGHGLENNRDNWLLPKDARIEKSTDLEYETISVSSILTAVRGASRLRMVVLDACRNNPLGDRMEASGPVTRTVARGLAPIEPSGDVLVAYSAKHGTLAEDGPTGGTSPFAEGLLAHIATPGLDIRIVMGRVKDHVYKVTGGRQEPFTYGSVGGQEIKFVDRAVAAAETGTPNAGPSADELAWMQAIAANSLEAYRGYLAKFPVGRFADEAKTKVNRLGDLQSRWQMLRASTDRIPIEQFVVDAENTEFSMLAKQRLSDIYLNEQRAWEAAEEAKLVKSYEAFLAAWPTGRNAENARDRLAELAAIRTEWAKLAASDDETLLESFVRRHGWSEFGAAAGERLVRLRKSKKGDPNDIVKALSAEAIVQAIDGKTLRFSASGMAIHFDTNGQPEYRSKLGKDFFRRQFKKALAGEGSFQADVVLEKRQQRIEGLGAVVRSDVDGTGSLFFLQMYGNERSTRDVDGKDRRYAYLQILEDYFGFVCVVTTWEPILSNTNPEKVVERCKASR